MKSRMKMASRRLARRPRPGFIPLPPQPAQAQTLPPGHAGPRSSGPTANSSSLNPNHSNPNRSPSSVQVSSPGSSDCDNNIKSIAIPPLVPAHSPYYSPSQLFPPPAPKSYFPAYLSASHSPLHHHHHSHTNHQNSSNTPSPRSPSPSSPSSYFPSMSTTSANPSSSAAPSASSPLAGKARPAAASSSSSSPARASYHALLAQQQLAFQMQQRELIYQATRGAAASASSSSAVGAGGPISPRLLPLGSPGPVTPLTLEDNPAGYLGLLTPAQVLQLQQHHLEKLAAASAVTAEQSEDPKAS
ncbi:hypothetical protein Dda_7750 [Drechslerella dactyloides]|uniref:Uncharacterized protein n=1 Tax=Drechslerella dactyloides TaxID=74499 RepID=A0AAD6ISR3_DREDA|nr:hypothetical protein Dda_7750 [Drechslerella dactyloides]